MKCLQDFIGLKACSILTIPDSGLYLNQLPGVEIANIDQIATAEQINYAGVWADIQSNGIRRFRQDVISELGKRYRLRQIQQSVDLGKQIDTTVVTAHSAQWRGFTIELNYKTDTLVKSNMQHIYIQTFSLYLPAAVNLNVKIFDLDLGDELFTYALTGVQGWNTIKVFKGFDTRRVFCCYDASAVDSIKFDINNFYLDNFSYLDYYYYSFWNNSQTSSRLMGAVSNGLTPTVTDVTQAKDVFGLSAVWSIKCSFDNVVCQNKDHFAQALLYCLGSELMTERINTSRINRWTTVDLPKAKELRKYFEAKYKGGVYDETQYQGELTQAVYGIELNQYDSCISCDNQIQFIDSRM
jgi:hypothetical protein